MRSVDLSKDSGDTGEASIIIQLCFPAGLTHGGVALADLEDQDLLNLFALTRGGELCTISLSKEFFSDTAASDNDV